MRKSGMPSKLSKSAFEAIAALAHRDFGLRIVPEKMTMVQSRLRHRLRALNLQDFEAYSTLVCSAQGADERRCMISALTTNVSHFFREPHHFDILSQTVLPDLKKRIQSGGRIRIWSAGCSNGQEPYSIAMHLLRAEPLLAQADFKILATDIDPKVIAHAQAGIYTGHQTTGVCEDLKAEFLQSGDDTFTMTQTVRKHVRFRELNLLADWPMQHRFDAIFCRNVVIYFDHDTQERLWPRFHGSMNADGTLFLGHSERISPPARFGFKTIGTTAYKKITAPGRLHASCSGDR